MSGHFSEVDMSAIHQQSPNTDTDTDTDTDTNTDTARLEVNSQASSLLLPYEPLMMMTAAADGLLCVLLPHPPHTAT